jgi:hypothetical protein
MGLPISTPIDENAYKAPLRAPSWLICPSLATMAGIIDSVQPDANPYIIAYMMMGAFAAAGNQRARVMIAPNAERTIMTLKTPKVSPA